MIRWLISAIGYVLLTTASAAQLGGGLPFPGPGAGSGTVSSYVGPADTAAGAPQIWWSCAFSVSAAYANGTNTLCRLKDVSTGAVTVCTVRVTTAGAADLTAYCPGSLTPAAACAAAAGGSCVVDLAPNQANSGTNDMQQTVLANMPGVSFADFGGLPTVVCSGTSVFLETTANITVSNPYTLSAVGITTGNFTTQSGFVGGSGGIAMGHGPSAATVQLNAGSANIVVIAAADSAWHGMNGLATGGTGAFVNVDGTDNGPGNANIGTMSGTKFRSCRSNAQQVTGRQAEGGYWNGTISRTVLYNNQHDRYGIF